MGIRPRYCNRGLDSNTHNSLLSARRFLGIIAASLITSIGRSSSPVGRLDFKSSWGRQRSRAGSTPVIFRQALFSKRQYLSIPIIIVYYGPQPLTEPPTLVLVCFFLLFDDTAALNSLSPVYHRLSGRYLAGIARFLLPFRPHDGRTQDADC